MEQPLPTSPVPHNESNQKSNKTLLLVLALLLLVGFGFGGYIFLGSRNSPEPSSAVVASISPSPKVGSPSPRVDETSNWEVYTNTKDGYLLKYPPLLKFKDCAKDVRSCPREQIRFESGPLDETNEPLSYWVSLEKKTNTEKLPLKDFIDSLQVVAPQQEIPFSEEYINGMTVYRAYPMPGRHNYETVLFSKDGTDFVTISFNFVDHAQPLPKQDQYYPYFDKILSTFEFIDPTTTEVSEVKTYSAEGFTFTYPADWSIRDLLARGKKVEWLKTTTKFVRIGSPKYPEHHAGTIRVTTDSISKVISFSKEANSVSGSSLVSEKESQLNGYDATVLVFENAATGTISTRYYINRNNLTYEFDLGIEASKVFSSFKFNN